ncbi:MAG: chemotaxis protein CheA [Hydrocarboniphaga sp.]|uniref:chemotaxis protein CheA n=1 Tax=Hydrocarboniphaga sp. TaxID=2033016 RepID=UPI002607856B|nr:chemotaxis protein CheA [Hydrocarboniphaga sp.]MDB5972113.1 chemotaxis protein CheA [Hydrocarboniphaga sp.]
MGIELDSELRDDFLTESRELLSRLAEQLVELEHSPGDRELLNAVFRGFHTIKGSAGFFDLTPVVRLAHAAEEIFGLLRAGRCTLDAAMLDAVLEALDGLRGMLEAVAAEREPPQPNPELIEALQFLAVLDDAEATAPVELTAAGIPADPFSDDEFEKLLDQLQSNGPAVVAPDGRAGRDPPLSLGLDDGGSRPALHRPSPPALRDPPPGEGNSPVDPEQASIRVDTHRLDQLMDLIGELVLVRNRIKTLGVAQGASAELRKAYSELDVTTSGLQNQVTRMRMQPIRKLFARFPKLARDTARKLGKNVEVERCGEDTELDKTLIEALGDPLMHMVRNAIDHGLEMPDVRLAAGKPACGRVLLSAEQMGGQIVVTISDDGAGMDPSILRAKAVERGLIDASEAARMSRDECLQLIFMAGFSTKDQVSDLSGRGVGMDVVRSNIQLLNGVVTIESTLGQGSTIRMRLPLTLAIQPVLMVERGLRLFAIPLQAVQDVFRLDHKAIENGDQRWETTAYRGGPLRLMRLSSWLGFDDIGDDLARHVVVVMIGNERYGLVVGSVRGREEIVVKPLGRMLKGLAGIAGGTVTSDGRIALILELPGLVSAYERANTTGPR